MKILQWFFNRKWRFFHYKWWSLWRRSIAFIATATSPVMPISAFGYFAASCVIMNYILVMTGQFLTFQTPDFLFSRILISYHRNPDFLFWGILISNQAQYSPRCWWSGTRLARWTSAAVWVNIMNFVFKNEELCIKNEELCIKSDRLSRSSRSLAGRSVFNIPKSWFPIEKCWLFHLKNRPRTLARTRGE